MEKIDEFTKTPNREPAIILLRTTDMEKFPVYTTGYFANGWFYPDRSCGNTTLERITQKNIHSYMTLKDFAKMVKRDKKAQEIIELMNQLKKM